MTRRAVKLQRRSWVKWRMRWRIAGRMTRVCFTMRWPGWGWRFGGWRFWTCRPRGISQCCRSGRLAIVFNGEVYNHEELKRELGSGPWRGHSDTEVMLEAIERWGVERAVRRFIGMFAFALWDRTERQLYLVRDRLGIKPLYYGRAGSAFVFASELKAIRRYPGFEGEIDRDALAAYLRHNYVPTPRCIYKGLCKLPPGS